MYALDRVLVGVVKRLQDLQRAQEYGVYHLPQSKWDGGDMDYLAIFLNGKLRKQLALSADSNSIICLNPEGLDGKGAVCYYAEVYGYELAYRYQIIPSEAHHPRAHEIYYWLKLGPLQDCKPPIENVSGRRFSFIQTSWERFVSARQISHLYPKTALVSARSA